MIQLTQLRIGNLILFDNKVDRVVSIGKSYVNGNRHQMWYADRIHPIPLSVGLLECVGFKYHLWPDFIEYTHMQHDGFILRIHDGGVSVFNLSPCDGKPQFLAQCQYVHELQNIIFAISGKEL